MSRRRDTQGEKRSADGGRAKTHTLRIVCDRNHPAREVDRYKYPKDASQRRQQMETATSFLNGEAQYDAPRLLTYSVNRDVLESQGEVYHSEALPGRSKIRWQCTVPGCTVNVTLSPEIADKLADRYALAEEQVVNLRQLAVSIGDSK